MSTTTPSDLQIPGLIESTPTFDVVGGSTVSLSGLYAQWLRGLTINAHERLALAHLSKVGPMTMSELGARIPLSRAAVTALTDRLEALGYVVRTPDTQDRRRTLLSVTERPGQLMKDLSSPFTNDLRALETEFSEGDLDVLRRFHGKLEELADRHAVRLRARSEEELPVAAPATV